MERDECSAWLRGRVCARDEVGFADNNTSTEPTTSHPATASATATAAPCLPVCESQRVCLSSMAPVQFALLRA